MRPHRTTKRAALAGLAAVATALTMCNAAWGAGGFGYGDPRSTSLDPAEVEATSDGGFLLTRRAPSGALLRYRHGRLTTLLGRGSHGITAEPQPIGSVSTYAQQAIEEPDGSILVTALGVVARIRHGKIAAVAGGGDDRSSNGIPALDASIQVSPGLAVDRRGRILVVDGNFAVTRIRAVTPDGTIYTLAGEGFETGEGAPAYRTFLLGLTDIEAEADGSYLLAIGNRIRRIAPDGTVTTFAGSEQGGFAGDGGPAGSALFRSIDSIDRAPDGSLIVGDAGNRRIRRIAPDGTVTTIAGSGDKGYAADGTAATDATILPTSASSTPDGRVVFVDQGRVRSFDPGGSLRTLAGMPRSEECRNQPYNGIQGTDGHDSLGGRSKRDAIRGEAGNDLLRGRDEGDCLDAGGGSDRVVGGPGNDVAFGEDGHDLVIGSGGGDLLSGSDGNDRVEGGDGGDELYGGYGDDLLLGGNGRDRIVTRVHVGNGRAGRFPSLGADTVKCGPGRDTAIIGRNDEADRHSCERIIRD